MARVSRQRPGDAGTAVKRSAGKRMRQPRQEELPATPDRVEIAFEAAASGKPATGHASARGPQQTALGCNGCAQSVWAERPIHFPTGPFAS